MRPTGFEQITQIALSPPISSLQSSKWWIWLATQSGEGKTRKRATLYISESCCNADLLVWTVTRVVEVIIPLELAIFPLAISTCWLHFEQSSMRTAGFASISATTNRPFLLFYLSAERYHRREKPGGTTDVWKLLYSSLLLPEKEIYRLASYQ